MPVQPSEIEMDLRGTDGCVQAAALAGIVMCMRDGSGRRHARWSGRHSELLERERHKAHEDVELGLVQRSAAVAVRVPPYLPWTAKAAQRASAQIAALAAIRSAPSGDAIQRVPLGRARLSSVGCSLRLRSQGATRPRRMVALGKRVHMCQHSGAVLQVPVLMWQRQTQS